MTAVVEKSQQIAAAPETVWGLLVNVDSWTSWWGECTFARVADNRTLHEGSELEVVLQPLHRKWTLHPVVDMITEGKTLSLTHQSALLQTTVVWSVGEGPTGTKVHVRGVFKGFQVWVMGLLSRKHLFQQGLAGNLRGLRKVAERMVE